MNFFDAQDSARRATRGLIAAYGAATLLIVAGVTAVVAFALYDRGTAPDVRVLAFVAAGTALLIFGATLYKTARLASGGATVARELGGTPVPPDVGDPARRRLRNVVEEMAIASGVPVPEIFVLEQEAGINAFAAGFTPGDAAIAVTRGTLELLDRDELQGVIAHEFSHILNGDMRLNIRMMGVLFGIMVLGLIGRLILRGGYHGRLVSGRRSRGSGPALMIGLGLVVLGAIGVFFARLTKAAVSRQREYLADASAVQFTRQTDGIANALKKILSFSRHSYLSAADPEEVSHMLFAHGAKLSSLLATHPPLPERIRALEPGFRAEDLPRVELPATAAAGPDERASGFAVPAAGPGEAPASIADTVGNPTIRHVMYAGALRVALPESLYAAAHGPDTAWLLILALFVDRDTTRARHALELLAKQLGRERAAVVRDYHRQLADGGPEWRLPLTEIAFPALKQTPAERVEFLLDLARRLIELDGRRDLYEFCLFRVLKVHLGDALAPARGRQRASKRAVREAALTLLAIIAERGHADPGARQRAFAAGLAAFGSWAEGAEFAPPRDTVEALEHSIDVLRRTSAAAGRTLVQAVADTVSADRRLDPDEAELLRVICASLDCPLPPLSVTGIGSS